MGWRLTPDETGNLEDWLTSPYEGHEGFLSTLVYDRDQMNEEDQEWLDEMIGEGDED